MTSTGYCSYWAGNRRILIIPFPTFFVSFMRIHRVIIQSRKSQSLFKQKKYDGIFRSKLLV